MTLTTTLKERIETALGDGAWHKLDDLLERMSESGDSRQVRATISASGDFISNSTRGYRLTRCATTEEIQHSLNDLRSRAEDLERRARSIEMVARYLPINEPPTNEEILAELIAEDNGIYGNN